MVENGRLEISQEQEQIILGSLLGDACAELNGKHARIKFDHSLSQSEYVRWKYQKLNSLTTKLVNLKVFDRRFNKYYEHIRFNTKTHQVFDKYLELFYQKGFKSVPENITELVITPIALTTWYLDDGAKRSDCNALRIHTNSYSLLEQEILVQLLQASFGINSKIHKVKQDEEYVIYVPSSEAIKFSELIKPIVSQIPSMKYKLIDRVTTEERISHSALI